MKNYTITVNGNVYEVTVEEGFTGAKTAPRAAASAPAPVRPAAPAPAPAAAPVQAAQLETADCQFPPPYRRQPRLPLPQQLLPAQREALRLRLPCPERSLA